MEISMIVNIYYIIFSILSFPINILLIYLIIVKSPASFQTYRILLLNTSISETCLIFFSFLLQTRIISAGESIALLSYGPLRYTTPELSFIAYQFYNLFLCTTNLSILLSMYYRYCLICRGSCETKNLLKYFVSSWLIPIAMLIAILIPSFDFEIVKRNAEKMYPNYRLSQEYGIYGGFKSTSSAVYLINTTILMGIPYLMPIFIFYWRSKIHQQVYEVQTHLSQRTKKFTLDLIRALTMQAVFPMICLLPNVAYWVTAQFVHIEFPLAEYIPLPTCIIPCLVDPLLTIYYVAPYRSFIVRKRSGSVGAVTISVASTKTL